MGDPRLQFDRAQAGIPRYMITGRDLEKFWVPNYYISHTTAYHPFAEKYLCLVSRETTPKDGLNIRWQMTNSYTVTASFDVRWFPFDVQMFQVKIAPEQNEEEMKLVFGTRCGGGPTFMLGGLAVSGLRCPGEDPVKSCVMTHDKHAKYQSGSYSYLMFDFYLQRQWGSYLMTWFIPLQVIWLIAYLTYFQDPEGNGGRDGISITAFLAMVFYQTEIKGQLPRVEYITWFEVYLFIYTLLVGVSCIEFVICI